MPQIQIDFPNVLNVSVQIGDIAYFTPTASVGGFDTAGTVSEIGVVAEVGEQHIICELTGIQPGVGNFIMFAKDRRANMGSLLGYFAKFKFVNDSTKESEMYSVGVDIFESSK